MDATELLKNKQALTAMIRDAVERRDKERLEAITIAVHDLELLVIKSWWDLEQLSRGTKPPARSALSRRVLSVIERMIRSYAVYLMSLGVSLAWKAARIRSRIKGGPVPLEFEAFRENSSPLG
jgi:hypothetical protein